MKYLVLVSAFVFSFAASANPVPAVSTSGRAFHLALNDGNKMDMVFSDGSTNTAKLLFTLRTNQVETVTNEKGEQVEHDVQGVCQIQILASVFPAKNFRGGYQLETVSISAANEEHNGCKNQELSAAKADKEFFADTIWVPTSESLLIGSVRGDTFSVEIDKIMSETTP